MENHTAPAAEEKLELTPETSELEALCAAVHPAVERAGEALEKRYYERLAEEALGPKWPNGKPPEETQALLDRVRHVSGKAEEVDAATAGLEVHHAETVGRSKGVTVFLKPGQSVDESRDVSVQPVNLQRAFVALCGEEETRQ